MGNAIAVCEVLFAVLQILLFISGRLPLLLNLLVLGLSGARVSFDIVT